MGVAVAVVVGAGAVVWAVVAVGDEAAVVEAAPVVGEAIVGEAVVGVGAAVVGVGAAVVVGEVVAVVVDDFDEPELEQALIVTIRAGIARPARSGVS